MATYLQTDRPLQIDTPLGPDKLFLLGISGTERLSECYNLVLELGSDGGDVEASSLLRKMVTAKVQLPDGSMRSIHGWVARFAQLSMDDKYYHYRAEIVPALWFLSLWQDVRIFQNKDALQIVEAVLNERGVTFRKDTTVTPKTREYCVQYRESDLDFISRLLEEEGIFFYFDHSGSSDELVLADAKSSMPDCPAAHYRMMAQVQQDEDVIFTLHAEDSVHTSKITLTDYNMETPSASLLRTVNSTADGKGEEVYDYPGKYPTGEAGEAKAKLLIEGIEAEQRVVLGTSNCRAFQPGSRFNLADHFNAGFNKEYQLVSVTHRATSSRYRSGEQQVFEYDNDFVATPSSQAYLPPLAHPRPVVRGTQTALVVGPSGEEIYVDKYGRVKVQFYWDRLGKKNDESSCWVRVATQWAGTKWGIVHIPRIGQEVIVDFLEGDPDHPIITGSVYNADQMPPYELPGNKTQSGIKSRSSLKGDSDHFNEIRFEDKKDSEEIHVQAQKDLTTLVKHDETRTVNNNRTTTIENDETRTVNKGKDEHTVKKGDQIVTVEQGKQTIEVKQGDQAITVGQGNQTVDVKMGDQKVTVGQGNRSVEVKMGNDSTKVGMGNQSIELQMGNRTVKLSLGSISEEALQGIELKVGQSSVKIDQMGVTIKGMMVQIEGQIQTQVKGLMTQVNADAMLMLKGAITMVN